MSQKTLISFYQKKQKKNKGRISDLLSGRTKKRSEIPKSATASTPAVAEASTSAAAASTSATSSFLRARGESEMEDVLIRPFVIGSDEESQTFPPTRVTKRRRTEEGREEQHSDGNFQKIFKKFNKNILQCICIIYFIRRRTSSNKKKKTRSCIRLFKEN